MLDILRDHLVATTTPELLVVLEQAHAAFERIELQNYEQGFEELLMTHEDIAAGSTDTVSAVVRLTDDLLKRILRDHGVQVVDEVPSDVLVKLVNALLDIPEYSDVWTLQATAAIDGLSNSTFADIVELVSDLEAVNLMPYLEEVDFMLIKKIREISKRELSDAELARENQRVEQDNGKHIRNLLKLPGMPQDLHVVAVVRGGGRLGLPFVSYLQPWGHNLQQLTPERSAQELLAMALASKDGYNRPPAMIAEHIEQYINNLDQITKINIAVTNWLVKLNELPPITKQL